MYAFEFSSDSYLQKEFVGPLAGMCLLFATAGDILVHTEYLTASTFQNCGAPKGMKLLNTGSPASKLAEMTCINQAQQV